VLDSLEGDSVSGKVILLGGRKRSENKDQPNGMKSSQYLLALSQSLLQLITVRFNRQSRLVRLHRLAPEPKSLEGRTLSTISLGPLWSEGDTPGGVIKGLLVLLKGTRGSLRGGCGRTKTRDDCSDRG